MSACHAHSATHKACFESASNAVVGTDISVGIATRYGLDGPGIQYQWGARFSAPVQNGPAIQAASCTAGTGYFPGVKRSGHGADHPLSSAEVKERVQLYLYSPLGPSWPVLAGSFTSALLNEVPSSICDQDWLGSPNNLTIPRLCGSSVFCHTARTCVE